VVGLEGDLVDGARDGLGAESGLAVVHAEDEGGADVTVGKRSSCRACIDGV
jgi:hypothetical protein